MKNNAVNGRSLRPVLVLLLGAGVAACQGPTEAPSSTSIDPNQSPAGQVYAYWTSLDADNQVVVHREQITEQQKQSLIAARRVRRAQMADGSAQSSAVEPRGLQARTKYTIGSTDWQSACQSYDWILYTSGADQTGDIFCTTYSTSWGVQYLYAPFAPQWYDGSPSHYGILCTGTTNCATYDCGLRGDAVAYFYTSGGGNLSVPANARYIAMDSDIPGPRPC